MIDDDTTLHSGGFTGSARQRAIEAYEDARDSVAGASRRAADGLAEAPLIALAGGLAAGALIAALLPRTDSERRLVRPTARRVRETARAAYDAAKETVSQRLDELGLNREKGEETIRSLLQGVTDAAKASAEAALGAARNKPASEAE
jgi:hypothetical protein